MQLAAATAAKGTYRPMMAGKCWGESRRTLCRGSGGRASCSQVCLHLPCRTMTQPHWEKNVSPSPATLSWQKLHRPKGLGGPRFPARSGQRLRGERSLEIHPEQGWRDRPSPQPSLGRAAALCRQPQQTFSTFSPPLPCSAQSPGRTHGEGPCPPDAMAKGPLPW